VDELPAEGFKLLRVEAFVSGRLGPQRFTVFHGVLRTRAAEEICNKTTAECPNYLIFITKCTVSSEKTSKNI